MRRRPVSVGTQLFSHPSTLILTHPPHGVVAVPLGLLDAVLVGLLVLVAASTHEEGHT